METHVIKLKLHSRFPTLWYTLVTKQQLTQNGEQAVQVQIFIVALFSTLRLDGGFYLELWKFTIAHAPINDANESACLQNLSRLSFGLITLVLIPEC